MAIKESRNWVRNQRVDVTDLRAIDQAAIYDAAMLLKCFQNQTPYILSGFTIPTVGITGPATALQVVVDGAVVWIPNNQEGSYLKIDPGTPNEVLSGSNPKVIGAFSPNQNNYLGVRLKRRADAATSDLVAIWDVDAQVEFNKTVPRGLVLGYEFVISSTDFGDTVPIAIIKTSLSNNVESITNAKQSMFRLGRGGQNPNKSFNFDLNPSTEHILKATTPADPDPFTGGDWELDTFKDWMDLVMTSIKKLKGSAYWYSNGSSAINNINMVDIFNDALLSTITGRGRFQHANPGQLKWTSDVSITTLTGLRKYTIELNPSGSTLADGEVLYITLVRNEDFQPINSFSTTSGSHTINAAINVSGLSAGDYVKFEVHPDSAWRKVSAVSGSTITLDAGGPAYPITVSGEKLLRSKGYYPNSDIHIDARENVPADGNTYWIAYREDNNFTTFNIESPASDGATRLNGVATITSVLPHVLEPGATVNIQGVSDSSFDGIVTVTSVPDSTHFTYTNAGPDVGSGVAGNGTVSSTARIYLRALGELSEGESREIDDNVTENILSYIGSPSDGTDSPTYSSNIRGTVHEHLTQRIGVLTDAMGDEQEDRSAFLTSDQVITWTGTQLEFLDDIILQFINTKNGTLTNHRILVADSPIVINNGDSIWVSVDRTDVNQTLTVNNSSVTPIPAQNQANKDVFILFKRIDSTNDNLKLLYIPFHKQLLTEGQTTRLGQAGGGGSVVKATFLDPVSTTLPTGVSYTADGVAAVNGDTVLFTNLSAPADNNKIYKIGGVGTSITWQIQRLFNGFAAPTSGDSVRLQKGDMFAEQLALFNGTVWHINDKVRYFNGTDFWEQSSLMTTTLADNTTDNIFTIGATGSENVIVDYSILRSGIKEVGTLLVTHDGTNASYANSSTGLGATGVSFSADINAGNLRVRYTTTAASASATFKFTVKRWSDGAGGPSGVPSYTVNTNNIVAAAFVMSDNSGTPVNCAAAYLSSGKTRVDLNFSYLLGRNSGSTSGDLDVYVNGQRIPRFISGATVDAYYQEIDSDTIEFYTDLSTAPVSIEIVKRI